MAIALATFWSVAGFLVLYQQSITFGAWFEIKDVLHHETIFVVLVALGIGIVVGFVIAREKQP